MPVSDGQAFVFNERAPAHRAQSLQQFVELLDRLPSPYIQGHLERHDFSRWLAEVFRDRPIAAHVAALEARALQDDARVIADAIVQAIRARYDMKAEEGAPEPSGA